MAVGEPEPEAEPDKDLLIRYGHLMEGLVARAQMEKIHLSVFVPGPVERRAAMRQIGGVDRWSRQDRLGSVSIICRT